MNESEQYLPFRIDPDLHLPPSLVGLSVTSAINHCQVSFALVDGCNRRSKSKSRSCCILYPCYVLQHGIASFL